MANNGRDLDRSFGREEAARHTATMRFVQSLLLACRVQSLDVLSASMVGSLFGFTLIGESKKN